MASLSRKRGRNGNTDTQSGFQQSSETIVNDYKTQIVAANSDIITAMNGICDVFGQLYGHSQDVNFVAMLSTLKSSDSKRYFGLYGNILLYCSLKQAILINPNGSINPDGYFMYEAIEDKLKGLQNPSSPCFRGQTQHSLLKAALDSAASASSTDQELAYLINEVQNTKSLYEQAGQEAERRSRMRTRRDVAGGRNKTQKGGGIICSSLGKQILASAITGALLIAGTLTVALLGDYLLQAIDSVYAMMVSKGAAAAECGPGPLSYGWQYIKNKVSFNSIPSCRQLHEFNRPATTWLKNKITQIVTALNAATGGYGSQGVLGISIGGIQQAVKANLVEPLCNSTDGSISSLTKYDEEFRKSASAVVAQSQDGIQKINSSINLVLQKANAKADQQATAINNAADAAAQTQAIDDIATSNIVLNNAICTVDVNGGNFTDQTKDNFLTNLFSLSVPQLGAADTNILFLAPPADQAQQPVIPAQAFRVGDSPFRKLYLISYAQKLKNSMIPAKLERLKTALEGADQGVDKSQFINMLTNTAPSESQVVPAFTQAAGISQQQTQGGKRRMTRKKGKKKHHKKRHHAKKHATKKRNKKGKRKTGKKKHHKKRHHAKKHATRKHGKKHGRKTRKR